jgi:hypothetical protein
MRKILMVLIAMGMVTGVAASAFAASPKTKAECQKSHMKWDEAAKTCS